MTAKVLKEGIALHRYRITERYAQTCTTIIKQAKIEGLTANIIQDIENLVQRIKTDKRAKAETFLQIAENIAQKYQLVKHLLLNNLAYLLRCFGLGFAKIDVRHNALDIMATVTTILHDCKIMNKARFSNLSLDEQGFALSLWLRMKRSCKFFLKSLPPKSKIKPPPESWSVCTSSAKTLICAKN